MTSRMRTDERLTVGIVGAGAATQAIHLPALSRVAELFEISWIVDIDPLVAEAVAGRVGARWGVDPLEMIADPSVDVVAIVSPPSFHAEQVIAACRAGKKAVLCEKPLCVTAEEAAAIGAASREYRVPVLTATMHLFDPAFMAATAAWPTGSRADFVQSICFLPPNEGFIELATELVVSSPQAGQTPRTLTGAEWFELAVLGLTSHHIPLVRTYFGDVGTVRSATLLEPFGYDIVLESEGRIAHLIGLMPDTPRPNWRFRAISDEADLEVAFPPSYVQAGSAVARLTRGATEEWRFDSSGYVEEWRTLFEVAGAAYSPAWADDAVRDFSFAWDIIAGATGNEVSA